MGDRQMAQQFCGDVGVFYEGLAVKHGDDGWFHITQSGKPAYPQRYRMAEYFQEGVAWVQEKDGTWIRIDTQGREVASKHNNVSFTS